MTDYLTVAEVLAMHVDQIERYGGSHGVRDPGLLESALFRPQTGYYADLIEEAAALWESLSQHHPFLDGNKRSAFAATYTFLAINGAQLTATPQGSRISCLRSTTGANSPSTNSCLGCVNTSSSKSRSARADLEHPGTACCHI
jgi:death on curing protein